MIIYLLIKYIIKMIELTFKKQKINFLIIILILIFPLIS